MNFRVLIPYEIATLTIGSIALAQQPAPAPRAKQPEASQPNEAPRRLTISVSITDPDDLKVTEGDRIAVGQLIADRTRDRNRLEAQARQLELTLQRLGPPLQLR